VTEEELKGMKKVCSLISLIFLALAVIKGIFNIPSYNKFLDIFVPFILSLIFMSFAYHFKTLSVRKSEEK